MAPYIPAPYTPTPKTFLRSQSQDSSHNAAQDPDHDVIDTGQLLQVREGLNCANQSGIREVQYRCRVNAGYCKTLIPMLGIQKMAELAMLIPATIATAEKCAEVCWLIMISHLVTTSFGK
ncbi:hypothetical protein BC938DRAFT_471285 [Jimgerdemannia flammicorona]|uniref:Uncharacterized protein n=1 Tax=Jimgerdemannia flammicorona TaxID=994334 RepID=A0A433Q8F7_9FUNG|nr:hypothetical protein BC938DRAFT_471285 [Jimgerdemannia flammicorona]